jgi:hypothetical protein
MAVPGHVLVTGILVKVEAASRRLLGEENIVLPLWKSDGTPLPPQDARATHKTNPTTGFPAFPG